VSNFIKTKYPKEGENKEQKERTHVHARKQKCSTRWASKRSGKKSAIDLTIIRSMLEKERGGTLKKTPSL
jgi:hypothetical protein